MKVESLPIFEEGDQVAKVPGTVPVDEERCPASERCLAPFPGSSSQDSNELCEN